jgi:hypothetical protein
MPDPILVVTGKSGIFLLLQFGNRPGLSTPTAPQ